MPQLADVADRLRSAVASQAYAEAQRLVPLYCALLECEFRSQHPGSGRARLVAEQARDLYQWLARTVILDRAHCATELHRLAGVSSYLRSAGHDPHTYRIDG